MSRVDSLLGVLRSLALIDPRRAFETLGDVRGLRSARPVGEPRMIDHDGDEVRALDAQYALLDGQEVAIVDYGTGLCTASIAGLTLVRREFQGNRREIRHYVLQPELEPLRATGRLGSLEDVEPRELLDMLIEHGVLDDAGIDAKGDPSHPDYVAFLVEHEAPEHVIDR